MIYRKDEKADQLVQIYFSFFTLAKVILLAKKVTKKSLESISKPYEVLSVHRIISVLQPKLKELLDPLASDHPFVTGYELESDLEDLANYGSDSASS